MKFLSLIHNAKSKLFTAHNLGRLSNAEALHGVAFRYSDTALHPKPQTLHNSAAATAGEAIAMARAIRDQSEDGGFTSLEVYR